jgi:glucose/arabinose dehydrogenase
VHKQLFLLALSAFVSTATIAVAADNQPPAGLIGNLVVPEGLHVELVAGSLPDARQMALSKDGKTLFVGTFRQGVVYRIRLDATGRASNVETLLEGLTLPSGIALREHNGREDLYVGALNEIWVVDNAVESAASRLLTDKLPDKQHHGWKYLRFGPDGLLYVPVGAPCNICKSKDPRFASILRMDPETGVTQPFVEGVRNSVGLAFHPTTEQLWFTDNGRDMMGDDVPPEEVNVVTAKGQHFGYPFIHAGNIPDPKYGKDVDSGRFTKPRYTIQAHSAALGLTFNTGTALGKAWQGSVLIAEHGSWNRSEMVGYRVSALVPDAAGNMTLKAFMTGFIQDGKVVGRPNDVLITGKGDLLVSDDVSNAVYRVSAN